MPLKVAGQTSLRKYRRKKVRTFFGIAPTLLLFIFIVLLSGLVKSLDVFVHDRVLSKVEQKEQIIELDRSRGGFAGPPEGADPRSDAKDMNAYLPADLEKIKRSAHVVDAQPERPLPAALVTTKDLAPGKELQLPALVAAPADLARIYGAEGFKFEPGKPVPVIINRAVFNHQYLDFGGKTDIVIESKDQGDMAKMRDLHPRKGKFLSELYSREKLIGKTFTVSVGGLPRPPQYTEKNEFDGTSPKTTIHKLSPAELQAEAKKQRDKVNPYWNSGALQKGVAVQFKIVGVNDSLDTQTSFIPVEAGSDILQKLYALQRSARTTAPLPDEAYASAFTGLRLTKDGQITSSGPFEIAPELLPAKHEDKGGAPPVGVPAQFGGESIAIPGWVYRFATVNNAPKPSEVKNFAFKPESLPIKAVAVKIDDAGNREKAQKALAEAGFAEAQNSGSLTTILRGMREGMNTALFWIVVVLTVINSLILIAAVSRTVADAQREIGVYRALGARKRDIRKLYVVFAALQTAIGIGVGLLLGLLLIFPLSHFLASKVQHILPIEPGSADGAFGFNLKVTPADLQHIDWSQILLYSGGLLLATVLVSLIPAARAARISPVEAIRRAD